MSVPFVIFYLEFPSNSLIEFSLESNDETKRIFHIHKLIKFCKFFKSVLRKLNHHLSLFSRDCGIK